MIYITRQDIIGILKKWSRGEVDAEAVHDWAHARYPLDDYEFDDREGEDSAAKEVLAHLDNLDMNLVTQDDIPALIEFLNTPAGQFPTGYDRWQRYEKSVNTAERRKKLRRDPLYKPFCK